MISRALRRAADRRGASRVVVVCLLLLVIVVGIASIPTVRKLLAEEARTECEAAMTTARRQLTTDYLLSASSGNYTSKDARSAVVMLGRDNICPNGGTVHIIVDPDGNSQPRMVCGLHDADTKLCTKLNAEYVLAQLEKKLADEQKIVKSYPKTVSFSLHSKELTAKLADEELSLRSGTDATEEYEGIVVYYGLVGHSDFGADSRLNDGSVCYFFYADENHYAIWTENKGWSGDCYG